MMNSRAENDSNRTRKTNIWRSNHTCLICQDLCPSSQDKENHEKQTKHRKKLLVYDFFAKEVPKSQKFNGPSVLLKRYTACSEQAIGLECIHELHFSFTAVTYWACSICYESGALMEQADMHLFSLDHIETYLDEFHSTNFSKSRMEGNSLKLFDEIKLFCDKVFEEQGRENLKPECLTMRSSFTKSEAMARLGIESSDLKSSYSLHAVSRKNDTGRRVLQCLICHQLVACNDEMLKRVWNTHELSPDHRRAVAVTSFLKQFQVESGILPETIALKEPFTWRVEKDRSYGPVCGVKFLVAFNKGNFCQLCCTPVESIKNHFSSEYHIMNFLTVSYPVEMFPALQYGRMSRMKKAVELISKGTFRLENERSHRVRVDWFPHCIAAVLKTESHVFPTLMPTLSSRGYGSNCLFCPVCLLTVNVPKDVKDDGEMLWNAHCEESSHFDFSIRRACFYFDEKFFVPLSSNMSKAPRMLHGHWSEVKDGRVPYYVQTQGDVGLEFIVDDLENEEVVCTLCARWFARGMESLINNHIRSYVHFYHYLHVNNRNLLSMVLVQKTGKARRELMLEWLQRSSCNELDEIRSYSPDLALQMLHWGSISIRKVDATSYDSEHRPVFECVMAMVDKVARDNVENLQISIKEALDLAGVKILAMKQRNGKVEGVLCRCKQCGIAFSSTIDTIVTNVWDKHLSSQQHFARFQAFMTNKLDMVGLSENTSSYTVEPFKHQRSSKKVTWHWNATKGAYDFVLTVVGLEDLVERRSSETVDVHTPDFFCRLCAVVIPHQYSSLEEHVRSLHHVLFYVHKYHPETIMEIDLLPKGGREMRRILAELLKDYQPKDLYCIPIYDPVGEQKRKAVIAIQKAKDEERQWAEVRKHTQEQWEKKDEERRKQRGFEIREEEIRLDERARKERQMRERSKHLEEGPSMEKIQQDFARKLKEGREAMKESEREAKEAERLRRQDELRILLDQQKQRLKALQAKEATQRHLMEVKEKLERKIHEVERHREVTVLQNNIPSLVQDSRCMPSLNMGPHPTYPANASHELYQHLRLGSKPSDMHMGPVPPPPAAFNIPSGGIRKPHENATQAVSKTFVPFVDTFVEHKRLEEEKMISTKVKLSVPQCQNVTFRPSLRDRKVDPYLSNGKIIQSRDQLVDFIWRQGAERIPSNELPVKFNEKVAEIEGALGIDSLYEVVCVDCSDLDTFYCSMCGVWTTPNNMFEHLETTGHKLAYLFRNYKMYHQTIVSESNFLARSAMLNQFAIKIWKMEQPPGKVSNRLRSLLDRATIERVWPEYVTIIDHSWKDNGGTVGRVEVPPPVSKRVLSLIDEEPVKLKEKEKYKDKKQFKESISVKESDNHSSVSEKREKGRDEREKEKSSRWKTHLSTSEKPKQRDNRRQSSPGRKRHRSRSLERRKSHSDKRLRDLSSSHLKHTHSRNRSHSRDRRRSGSRSRVTSRRTSRRSRSRSQIGNAIENSGLSWEASAAAFLTKLGDPKGAALVSQASNNSNVVDEKVKQWRSFVEPQHTVHTSSMLNEFMENQERLKKLQTESMVTDSDEKAQMRKLLGVLITMQQEAERCGSLDKSVVDKLYKEVGLKNSVDSSEQLLVQLCSQISDKSEASNKTAIDLQSFGITKPGNLQLQTSSSTLGDGFHSQPYHFTPQSTQPSLIQSLLNEVKRSLGKLDATRPPVVKSSPFVITNRDDMFQGNETIPYVYPGASCIVTKESTSQMEQPSYSGISLPSSVITQLPKNEKASVRREQLFQDTKQVRKQTTDENTGGVDNDDDDWDCLAEVINGPSPSNNDFGRSSNARHDYKYDGENDLKTTSVPGQKIPLARTILPNGEPLPSTISLQNEGGNEDESIAEKNINTGTRRFQGIPFTWPQPLRQPLLDPHMGQNSLLQPQQPQQQYSFGQEIIDQQQYCRGQHIVNLQQTVPTYEIPHMPQQNYYS